MKSPLRQKLLVLTYPQIYALRLSAKVLRAQPCGQNCVLRRESDLLGCGLGGQVARQSVDHQVATQEH